MTAPGQPPPHAHLDRGISAPRFATFTAAAGGDVDIARELYVWNRDLSVSFLADIAILEVALRNAMHDAATATWGPLWYSHPDVQLDERSARQLGSAWTRLPKSATADRDATDLPGRLVAQCTFGFWTNLLDVGGHTGRAPRDFRAKYERLWTAAFRHAFPGGKAQAAEERRRIKDDRSLDAASRQEQLSKTQFRRDWVHGVCKNINNLRNRVAHHEPLITGIPLPGQKQRLSTEEARRQCQLLAGMLDRDLAEWLSADSGVSDLLQRKPLNHHI